MRLILTRYRNVIRTAVAAAAGALCTHASAYSAWFTGQTAPYSNPSAVWAEVRYEIGAPPPGDFWVGTNGMMGLGSPSPYGGGIYTAACTQRPPPGTTICPSEFALVRLAPGTYSYSDAYARFASQFGASGTLWVAAIPGAVCTSLWTGYYGGPYSVIPGATACGTVAPAPVACTTTGPDPILDFKQVNTADADGRAMSVTITQTCTGPATIQYHVDGTVGPISLGPGLTADITVEGRPLGTGIRVQAGPNAIEVGATLRGRNPTPGAFNKSVVLVQSLP